MWCENEHPQTAVIIMPEMHTHLAARLHMNQSYKYNQIKAINSCSTLSTKKIHQLQFSLLINGAHLLQQKYIYCFYGFKTTQDLKQ